MLNKIEKFLDQYRNIFTIITLFVLVLFCVISVTTYNFEKKVSEDCGFDDGKIKCVCTESAWNEYVNGVELNISNLGIQSEGLNTIIPYE